MFVFPHSGMLGSRGTVSRRIILVNAQLEKGALKQDARGEWWWAHSGVGPWNTPIVTAKAQGVSLG
jgi:hypothetical protein